ncbi:MAG TPA: hypothetical protein PLW50_00960 [Smithellaceae bacterium]|nr:hypothetical protein [Smithellaceae bacterium]
MVEDKVKQTRFDISADELNHRMELKKKLKDDPAHRAVEILEAAVDTVLTKLGVNIELGDIPAQMDALGIVMTEHTDERAPQLNGFFIYVIRKSYALRNPEPDLIPYAWVGSARLNSNGECFCDIHWFQENKLSETGGIKLVG